MKSYKELISEAQIYKYKDDYIEGGKRFLETGRGTNRGALVFSNKIDDYESKAFKGYHEGYGPMIVVSDRTPHDEIIELGDKLEKKLKIKDVQRDKVILFKGTQTDIHLLFGAWKSDAAKGKDTGGKIDPTRFETDLVNEINSRNNKPKVDGGNDTPAARELAKSVIDHFFKNYYKAKGASKASGSSSKGNLTQVYIDNGVTSGEPKTDILVDKNRCSVKKAEGAQFASAQSGEMFAVMTSALENKRFSKTKGKLIKEIKNAVKHGLNKQNFYDLRAKFGDGTAFDQVFGKVMGLNPNKPTPDEITALSELFDKSGLGVVVSKAMHNFLTTDDVQLALFTEFITGQGRFKNPDHIPTHIFAWSVNNGTAHYEDIHKYIKSSYKSGGFKYRIADRGTGRGGAFRLEPKHLVEIYDLTTEEKTKALMIMEEFDEELNLMEQELLSEGLMDRVKAGSRVAVKALKDGIKFLIRAARSVLSFFAVLLSKGVGTLAKVFGLEGEMSVNISFPH